MGSQRVGHDWMTFALLHFTSSVSYLDFVDHLESVDWYFSSVLNSLWLYYFFNFCCLFLFCYLFVFVFVNPNLSLLFFWLLIYSRGCGSLVYLNKLIGFSWEGTVLGLKKSWVKSTESSHPLPYSHLKVSALGNILYLNDLFTANDKPTLVCRYHPQSVVLC